MQLAWLMVFPRHDAARAKTRKNEKKGNLLKKTVKCEAYPIQILHGGIPGETGETERLP